MKHLYCSTNGSPGRIILDEKIHKQMQVVTFFIVSEVYMANLSYCKGDLFKSTAQVIVNPVNCKGHMGKGLALSFKQRYPHMFASYRQECHDGKLHIGRPTLYRANTWILNFPTKDHWRDDSKIEYLAAGLEYFVTHYKAMDIKSIAFPKLGSGLGKLSWDVVGPLMVSYLSQVDIDVYIYLAEGDREYLPE
jgi:O-acetyl-ADP-ribose deacetylase (regulator of RNase III)